MRRSRHRADHDDPQYDAWVDSKIDDRRERSVDDGPARWASGIYRCWWWSCEGYGLREDAYGQPTCREHGGRGDQILEHDGVTMWLDGVGVEITDAVARALDISRAVTPAEHAAEQARYVEANPGCFDDVEAELAVIDGEWADEVETVLRRCA